MAVAHNLLLNPSLLVVCLPQPILDAAGFGLQLLPNRPQLAAVLITIVHQAGALDALDSLVQLCEALTALGPRLAQLHSGELEVVDPLHVISQLRLQGITLTPEALRISAGGLRDLLVHQRAPLVCHTPLSNNVLREPARGFHCAESLLQQGTHMLLTPRTAPTLLRGAASAHRLLRPRRHGLPSARTAKHGRAPLPLVATFGPREA
mmetsp:Transcript_75990/g.163070  ORF Transcript_75990/g.163070 Transcript_75990/m.163070 type:complete len:207 (+) Transcript_75990:270-890(+)